MIGNGYRVRKIGPRWWVERRGRLIAVWWVVEAHGTHAAAVTHADRLARRSKRQSDYWLAGG